MKICTVEGCDRKQHSKKLCNAHYKKLLKYGDPTHGRIRAESPEESLAARSKLAPSGCMIWTGFRRGEGYGGIWIDGRDYPAHRFSYETHVGEIPAGMLIDHSCRNRLCVNPKHLRLADHKQNGENLNLHSNNTSGYRGVRRTHGKWSASAIHNGKLHSSGVFDTREEANEAAIRLRNSLFTHNDLDRVA